MTAFYDAAVALLSGKKIDKSEADRVIELVNKHTARPEIVELQTLRDRLESALIEFESVQSTINNMSYDFNQLDRDTDSAMSELSDVRDAIDALESALEV